MYIMSYESASLICDYVSLYFEDAKINGNDYVFDIPAGAYLFGDRGQYCLVSAVAGSIREPTDNSAFIMCYKGASNHGADTASLDFPAPVGVFSVTGEVTDGASLKIEHQFEMSPAKYLVSARPTQITMNVVKTNKNYVTGVDNAMITLKFEYLSKTAVKTTTDEAQYTTIA